MRINIQKARRYFGYYALLLPTFIFISIFSFIPFLWAFTKSFYRFEIGEEPVFVGFQNFADYLHDPTLVPSFCNMLFLTFFAVCVTIIVPLTIAKLIFSLSSERARYYYRIIFLVPVVVPSVALFLIWGSMIYSDQGLLNEFLRLLNLENLTRGWLSNPKTVLWAIAFIGFPWANGINILIYYAGFSGIPVSVYEAAELDGATGIKRFFIIDIPLILSQVKLLVILTIIAGIQAFESIFILTRGGPGFKSMVPGLWMYFNAFSFQNMGMACAIGVILFLIILTLTLLNLRYFKSSEQIQGVEK
jgi:raffinose/stachyose/melibiose transport system permease protein